MSFEKLSTGVNRLQTLTFLKILLVCIRAFISFEVFMFTPVALKIPEPSFKDPLVSSIINLEKCVIRKSAEMSLRLSFIN